MWGEPLHPALIALWPPKSKKIQDNFSYWILDWFSWIWTLILEVFFVKQIDFLKSLRVQKCVLPHEIWTLKIVIFPRENTIFYKIHVFCFEVEIDGKHEKNKNKSLENQLFFLTSIFDWFWANLGGFGDPSWPSKNWVFLYFFQIASKRRPRAPQELPKSAQERPKSIPRTSKRVPRASKSPRVQKHAANREIWTPNVWKTSDFRTYFHSHHWERC